MTRPRPLEVGSEQGVDVERNLGQKVFNDTAERAIDRDWHGRPLPGCECPGALEHVQYPQMRWSENVNQVQEHGVQVSIGLIAQGDGRQGALQRPPLLLPVGAESDTGRPQYCIDPLVVG